MVVVGLIMTSLNAGGVNMTRCLDKFGWNYRILGMNEKWTNYKSKTEIAYAFAKSMDPEEVIIIVDAYDALCIRAFSEFVPPTDKIILGAEPYCDEAFNCHPVDKWWEIHPEIIGDKFDNHYVNSGFICGKSKHMCDLYEWCLQSNIVDDQVAVSEYTKTFPDRIWLDYRNEYCFNDNWGSTGKYETQNDHVEITRKTLVATPFFVHFPGFLVAPTKTILSPLEFKHPVSYSKVGKSVLKDQFILPTQVHPGTYMAVNVVFWVIVGVSFVLLVMVIVFMSLWLRTRKNLMAQNV